MYKRTFVYMFVTHFNIQIANSHESCSYSKEKLSAFPSEIRGNCTKSIFTISKKSQPWTAHISKYTRTGMDFVYVCICALSACISVILIYEK